MQGAINKSEVLENSALADLSNQQQVAYSKLPESMDYVCNPLFRKMEAWEVLFGDQAKEINVQQWALFPEVPSQSASRKKRQSLSREDEDLLFMRYNFARYRFNELAKRQQARFSKLRALSMLEWNEKMVESRDAIVSANMGLVVAMSTRTRVPNVEFAELVSEGNMALLRAIDKFDTSRGFKFSTYACRAILKAFNRLATNTGKYVNRFGISYEPEFEQSDYDVKKHEMQQAQAADDVREMLSQNTANLTPTEKTVVLNRFGMNSEQRKKTLAEVGQIVHLSNERVRQIQKAALNKLHQTLNNQYLIA